MAFHPDADALRHHQTTSCCRSRWSSRTSALLPAVIAPEYVERGMNLFAHRRLLRFRRQVPWQLSGRHAAALQLRAGPHPYEPAADADELFGAPRRLLSREEPWAPRKRCG